MTMTAEAAVAEIRLVLVSLADGRTDGVPVGCYLASYDPEADDDNGMARWTPDPAQALTPPPPRKQLPATEPFRTTVPSGQTASRTGRSRCSR